MWYFLKRLRYIFTHRKKIDLLLKKERDAQEEIILAQNQFRLKLCFEHRQEANQSRYSHHNCDHCKALQDINTLQMRLEKFIQLNQGIE